MKCQHGATAQDLAQVLVALSLLRPIDGVEALKHHLAARLSHLVGLFTAVIQEKELSLSSSPSTKKNDASALLEVLVRATKCICTTIAECGELFLTRAGVLSEPLVMHVAKKADEGGANELLFDPGSRKESTESSAWSKHLQNSFERLSGLSSAGVALECNQWLEQISSQVAPLSRVLLRACGSGSDLRAIEMAIKNELQRWKYSVNNMTGPRSSKGAGMRSTNGDAGVASIASSQLLSSATAEEDQLAWTDACQWVIGRPISLWTMLFETPLLDRSKEILAQEFGQITEEVRYFVDQAVVHAIERKGSLFDGIEHRIAGNADVIYSIDTSGCLRNSSVDGMMRQSSVHIAPIASAASGDALSMPGEGIGREGDTGQWMSRAEFLLGHIDKQLDNALATVLDTSDVQPHQQGPSPRAIHLQPYVQESASKMIVDVVELLTSAVRALPLHGGDWEAENAVYAALFVGRVALGMAERSAPLRVLLGPPSEWTTAASDASSSSSRHLRRAASASASTPATVSPRLDVAQRALRDAASEAYSAWAAWAAQSLALTYITRLVDDDVINAAAGVRGWEDVSLTAPSGTSAVAGSTGRLTFSLPAAPSSAAAAMALGACQEVDRAGGHAADGLSVQQLRWRLAGDLCDRIQEKFKSSPTGTASEKGVLQVLFDIRFLTTILAGDPPCTSTAVAETPSSRKKQISEAETRITRCIDPIDWATYESYLYSNVAGYIQRCSALLGLVLRGNTAPGVGTGDASTKSPLKSRSMTSAGSASGTSSTAVESNILRMATPGSRFAYLPVNIPSALHRSKSGTGVSPASMTSSSRRRGHPSGASALLDSGEECGYSFAKLTVHRSIDNSDDTDRDGLRGKKAATPSVSGTASASEESAGGRSAAAAALEAFKQSAFGSLLGDKAAEMSASLGEYSLSNLSTSGTGLLSSLQLPTFKR